MKFPNAFKGVKQIILAEILMIITALLVVGCSATSVAALLNVDVTLATVALVLLIFSAVAAVIAFIFQLMGVINGKKDDENFRNALIFILLGLVLSIVKTFLGEGSKAASGFDAAISICSLFVTYYILMAISSLAGKLNDTALKSLAEKTIRIVCIAFAASALVDLIQLFVHNETVILVLAVCALILEIIGYVLFLRVLFKAKKALA